MLSKPLNFREHYLSEYLSETQACWQLKRVTGKVRGPGGTEKLYIGSQVAWASTIFYQPVPLFHFYIHSGKRGIAQERTFVTYSGVKHKEARGYL